MSYTSTDLITYAVGDGTTGTIQTPPFEVDSDIVVLVRESGASTADTWVLDSDYTLSGAGTGANGTLTPITTKPDGATIVIYTDPSPTLTFDFSSLPTALQSPLTSALHQIYLQVRSLKAAQRQYIKTSLIDFVAKNNAGTAAVDTSRLGKLFLWNESTGAPDVISTDEFIGPPGQTGDGGTHNGRTILEVDTVTDDSAEFLSGATFELDPTNPRHFNIQIGDASTPLTDDMVVDLVPDSIDWPVNCEVNVIKGDTSSYTVTVSGFDADGEGTHTLSHYRESVRCVYQTTDGDNGPGAAGQKFARHSIVQRSALNISASNATNGLVADNVQEQLDELAAASGGSGLSSVTTEWSRLDLSVTGGVATIGNDYIAQQSSLDGDELTNEFVSTPLMDPSSTSADVTCNLSFGSDAGGEHIVCVMPLTLTGTITLRSADYATGGLIDGQASITAPGSGYFTIERLAGSTKHYQTSLVPAPTFTGSATFDAAIHEKAPTANITGSATVNLSSGQHQRLTLTGNVTALALSNRPPDGYSQTVLLDLIQDGTGTRTLAWFTGAKFPDGDAISITSAANAMTSVSVTVVGSAGDIIVRPAGYDIKAP